ncbi:MAG: hypothetical protein P4M12_03705 [Gammaproteobacteria bacterium]|nr:hypothetical protein [Gammaproteobacteria bacterium]
MPSDANKIIDLIKNAKEQFGRTPPLTISALPNFNSPQTLVADITKSINILEQLKYPESHYDCKKLEVDGKNILYVKCKGDMQTLSDEELEHMARMSLLIRKLSILGGIASSLNEFSDNNKRIESVFDTVKHILKDFNRITNALEARKKMTQIRKLIVPRPKDIGIDDFISHISNKFKKTYNENSKTGLKLTDELTYHRIRHAEKYFVAGLNANRYLINESIIKDKTYIQLDVPLNAKLTEDQSKSFNEIYEENTKKAQWFDHLVPWQQKRVRDVFTKNKNTKPNEVDSFNFDTKFLSSSIQDLPGLKNARTNYLIEEEKADNSLKILASSIKMAAPVPYEVSESFRGTLAEQNIAQLVETIGEKAKKDFEILWGKDRFKNNPEIKPLIFMHSLLSEIKRGVGNDSDLVEAQRTAINDWKKRNKNSEVEVIYGNDTLNFNRHFRSSDLSHQTEVLAYADKFLAELKKEPLVNKEQKEKFDLINAAKLELKNLDNIDIPFGRNRIAFKSAYLGLLVESLGGVVVSNCKSGKDRTGIDELYRNAMKIYYETSEPPKKLPRINDTGDDRKRFVEIFVNLFNSMKIQEAAAANTPGSFGVKEEYFFRIMCLDIGSALSKSFVESSKRAAWNKPNKLKKSEEEEKAGLEEKVKKIAEARKQYGGITSHPSRAPQSHTDVRTNHEIFYNNNNIERFLIYKDEVDIDKLDEIYDRLQDHPDYISLAPGGSAINFVNISNDQDISVGVYLEERDMSGNYTFTTLRVPENIKNATDEILKAEDNTPLPNKEYLEFAYKQCLAFKELNPGKIISIMNGEDTMLARAYEVACVVNNFKYINENKNTRNIELSNDVTDKVSAIYKLDSPAFEHTPSSPRFR